MSVKAGYHKESITPENSLELWGYVERSEPMTGIRDEIYVKVLIVKGASSDYAVVSLDLGGVDGRLSDEVKQKIEKNTGFSKENIIVCTTHTHSAPAALKLRMSGRVDPSYLKLLVRKVVFAFCKALRAEKLVLVGYGTGSSDVAANRREGEIRNDIKQDSGTIDHTIGVLRMDTADRKPYLLLVNYAMHPVTLSSDNKLLSADYPGVLNRHIRKYFGCDAIFLQGAAAEINPKIYGSIAASQLVGKMLSEKVILVASNIQTSTWDDLCGCSFWLSIRFDDAPEEKRVVNAINDLSKLNCKGTSRWCCAELDWAKELLTSIRTRLHSSHVSRRVPIQALKMGCCYFLFLPGEIFAETGLKIKAEMADENVCIVSYSNDCSIGYIPPRKAFQDGGYETDTAYKFYGLLPLASETEERLRKKSIEVLKNLKARMEFMSH